MDGERQTDRQRCHSIGLIIYNLDLTVLVIRRAERRVINQTELHSESNDYFAVTLLNSLGHAVVGACRGRGDCRGRGELAV